jgi:F-type H+-transporting ATPase subunit b
MNDAALSKMSAAELKAEYEKRVKDIETERASILDEARKTTAEKRSQVLDEAKAEATEIRDRASRDVERDLRQLKASIHQSIVEISTDMAGRFVVASVDKAAHDKLFEEALVELEATSIFSAETA